MRPLVLTSALTAAAAAVGSLGTKPDSAWYRSIDKPDWEPPGIAFPLVWTPLYGSIAWASARAVAAAPEEERGRLWALLGADLAANAGWCWAFFDRESPRWGLVVIGLLNVLNAALVREVGRHDTTAAAALTPYAAWTGSRPRSTPASGAATAEGRRCGGPLAAVDCGRVPRVEARISFVTLAVADLDAARRFYVDGLGWRPEHSDDEVCMILAGTRLMLSLWRRDAFEAEVGAAVARDGVPAAALAHNVATPADVDAVLETARAAGASHVGAGTARAWGGYTGYFADPDGFRWEVAHNPGPTGEMVLP